LGSEVRADQPAREGDFVLTLVYDFTEPYIDPDDPSRDPRKSSKGVYFAQLREAASDLFLMQDGPPTGEYFKRYLRPCRFYTLPSYFIAGEIGYIHPTAFRVLLHRTCRKMGYSVDQYQQGERTYFEYTRECCFCEE
jgi:hypothetical protein